MPSQGVHIAMGLRWRPRWDPKGQASSDAGKALLFRNSAEALIAPTRTASHYLL